MLLQVVKPYKIFNLDVLWFYGKFGCLLLLKFTKLLCKGNGDGSWSGSIRWIWSAQGGTDSNRRISWRWEGSSLQYRRSQCEMKNQSYCCFVFSEDLFVIYSVYRCTDDTITSQANYCIVVLIILSIALCIIMICMVRLALYVWLCVYLSVCGNGSHSRPMLRCSHLAHFIIFAFGLRKNSSHSHADGEFPEMSPWLKIKNCLLLVFWIP